MATTTAKKEAPETTITPVDPIITAPYVIVNLPKESKEQEDKVVWVNERRFCIKRGIRVSVPEPVAEILQNEERMLEYTYDFEDKVQKG